MICIERIKQEMLYNSMFNKYVTDYMEANGMTLDEAAMTDDVQQYVKVVSEV